MVRKRVKRPSDKTEFIFVRIEPELKRYVKRKGDITKYIRKLIILERQGVFKVDDYKSEG